MYFITYRLANSIPASVMEELHNTNRKSNDPKDKHIFKKLDNLLDSGEYGSNYLKIPAIAEIVKDTLHYPNGKEYNLICYCIMPNHVHLVFELLENNRGVSKIMQSIKRISARESNRFLKRRGKFWQDESFDRFIRNKNELQKIIQYVLMNPVKSGLVSNWGDWKYHYCHTDYLP